MKKLLFTILTLSASISMAGTILCDESNSGLKHIFIDTGDFETLTKPYPHLEAPANVTYYFGRKTDEIVTTVSKHSGPTRLGYKTTYLIDLQDFGKLEISKFLSDQDRTAQGVLFKDQDSVFFTCYFEN